MQYDKCPKNDYSVKGRLEMFWDYMVENHLDTLILTDHHRGLQLAMTDVLKRFNSFNQFKDYMTGYVTAGGRRIEGFAAEYLRWLIDVSYSRNRTYIVEITDPRDRYSNY